MNHVDTLMHRLATIMLVLGAVVATSFSQTTEKPKEEKPSGWIGVSIISVSEESSEETAAAADEGARIETVVKKSPADSAGLKKGDIVIEFGGKAIKEAEDLSKAVGAMAPGTKTTVTVMRNGEKKSLGIIVGKAQALKIRMKTPGSLGVAVPPPYGDRRVMIFRGNATLGMEVRELGEQLGEYFGAPDGEGVLVENVEKESAAEKAGFKAGDVIIRAGKKSVDEAEDIRKALRKQNEGDKLDFEIIRKGSKKTLTVTIPEQDEMGENMFHVSPNFRLFHGDGGAYEFESDGGGIHQFDIYTPRPYTKELQMHLERIQKDMKEKEKDLQKVIERKIRVTVDDEV